MFLLIVEYGVNTEDFRSYDQAGTSKTARLEVIYSSPFRVCVEHEASKRTAGMLAKGADNVYIAEITDEIIPQVDIVEIAKTKTKSNEEK